MSRKNDPTPENAFAPAITVKHSELKRISFSSIYQSHCPKCSIGVLMISRNRETSQILERDRCVSCDQLIIYSDVEELRKNDWVGRAA